MNNRGNAVLLTRHVHFGTLGGFAKRRFLVFHPNIAVLCLVICFVLQLNIAVEKSHVFQCVEAVILWRMFLRLQNLVSLCKEDIRPMPLSMTLRIRNPNNAMWLLYPFCRACRF